METKLKIGEKIEDLQNGFSIIQSSRYFAFGTDAVLLAHFADIGKDEYVVEFGSGCGIIPILLCAKTQAKHILGIEVQCELADMAQRSVEMNGLSQRVRIVCGDLKDVQKYTQHGADAVVVNPPYEKAGAGAENASEYVNIAKREVKCTLEDIIVSAAKVLRTGGRLYMIYRTQRFAELMSRLREYKIEPKRMMMVAQYAQRAPSFVLVEARKGAREGVALLPTLVVFDEDGSYTPPLKEIYGIKEEV